MCLSIEHGAHRGRNRHTGGLASLAFREIRESGEGWGLRIQSGADKKAEEGMGSRVCWGDAGFTGKTMVG